MADPKTPKITLSAGTRYSACFFDDGVQCDNHNHQLNYEYTGTFTYSKVGSLGTFKTDSGCPENKQPVCDQKLEKLEFRGQDLQLIRDKHTNVDDYIRHVSSDSEDPAGTQYFFNPFEPINVPILLISVLATLSAVYLCWKHLPRLLGRGSQPAVRVRPRPRPRPHSASAKPRPSSSAAEHLHLGATSNSSVSVSIDKISVSLSIINQKIERLESQVRSNAHDILVLEQQIAGISNASIAKQAPADQIFADFTPAPSQQPETPPPPPQLTVRSIKDSVLRNDYSLIAGFPHCFVSETNESRQGLEDKKKFDMEGDQDNAQCRGQSEFIVISCDSELYLIPNILPNAADPRKTMKRHADKNSIYRNGSGGGNWLDIAEIAVVRATGANQFELSRAGQLA